MKTISAIVEKAHLFSLWAFKRRQKDIQRGWFSYGLFSNKRHHVQWFSYVGSFLTCIMKIRAHHFTHWGQTSSLAFTDALRINAINYSQSNFLLILQDGSLLFMFIVKGIDTSARPCGSVCQRQTHSFTQSIKIHDVEELTGHRVIAASRPKHTYSQTHTGLPLHTWHSDNLCTRLYRTLCAFLLKCCFPHLILCIIKCVLLIAEANVN